MVGGGRLVVGIDDEVGGDRSMKKKNAEMREWEKSE